MIFKNFCYRVYQRIFINIMHLVKYNNKVISGKGMVYHIPDILKKHDITKVLVITGPHIVKSEMFKKIINVFKNKNFDYIVFYGTSAETGIKSVESVRRLYLKNKCSAIVAIGGGSVIDCAKAASVGIANFPVLVAVPTTAGTGAEVTACAVIKDINGNKKIIVNTKISPKYAVLDPLMTQDLPKNLIAYTGMDAFTHATESYINKYSSKNSRNDAQTAIKLIVENITSAYNNGDINSRSNMLKASYLAGRAFIRTSVGYVHAISHAIGSRYNLPHGMVVSVVLPYVLEWYGKCIYKKLSKLSDISGISEKGMSKAKKAKAYIAFIKMINSNFGINTDFYSALKKETGNNSINKKDVINIAKCAIKESNPYYPVPKIMSLKECKRLVYKIITNN